jgi:hypothetical protein
MAATNKSLAENNKSRTGGKAPRIDDPQRSSLQEPAPRALLATRPMVNTAVEMVRK